MAGAHEGKLKFRIPGYGVAEDQRKFDDDAVKVVDSRSFRLSGIARGTDNWAELDGVAADDVFEVELEDGTRLWTSSQRFVDEVMKAERPRSAEGAVTIPRGLPLQGASRGIIGKLAIKTLRWFRIDVAEMAARKLAGVWEERTLGTEKEGKGPGLYRVSPGADFELHPIAGGDRLEGGDQPLLIFLHGTASSTEGSFGELWDDGRRHIRESLLTPYIGRVLALEHRTLSESPLENAVQVAERLPDGAHLHLISHSRGGLVGEILCRAGMANDRPPFDEFDIDLFRKGSSPGHSNNLIALNKLLREKRLSVDRFVRVACPARGTTLASERLDVYMSLIFNLLERIPILQPATDVLAELIMAIAKKRSDPNVLPGLAAQIPGSPLIRVLNRPDRSVAGELRVIAGDVEGENALSAVGTLLTDPLYQGDHDLVVDTFSMYGGAERDGRAAASFHHGANVSHFRYFRNEDSAGKLARALLRKEGEQDGFEAFAVRQSDTGEPPYRREEGTPRPVVFLLPGIMGSHLSVGEERIWLDVSDLAFGGLSRIAIDEGPVQAGPPLWMAYGKLVRTLSATHDIELFPYDWRLSIAIEADRLADRIRAKLERAEQFGLPVSIVGHSMGGLVARAMIARHPDLWQRMGEHTDSRLVMLGTPNGGSHAMARALLGRDSLIKKLAILDVKNSKKALLDVISHFSGILELLPNSGSMDLFDSRTWELMEKVDGESEVDDWVRPTQQLLAQAKASRGALADAIDHKRMLYVAGSAPATPVDIAIEDNGVRGRRLVFQASPEGDGRVPWATGRLPGVKTWYMPAAHGDMANHEPAFEAIAELLQTGSTELLSNMPPLARGAAERFRMPEERSPLYPTEEDLSRAALGSGRALPTRKTFPKARVRICHGSLAYARHPVLVGHYAGDTILSAEAHLNRALDGRLGATLRLGLYPGPRDTEGVFLNPDAKRSGAIVVGLGQVGELSPGRLMRAVARGARKLALASEEYTSRSRASQDSDNGLGITALLVGSGAGGLPVEECVTQILRGVADANRAISESTDHRDAWVREIEFIELYEDRAIQAAHALRRSRHDRDVAEFFEIDAIPCVENRRGGRRRASLAEVDPWWQRLQVTEDDQGRLTFNRLTDRARTEVSLLPTQRAFVDAFIDDATETTSTDQRVAVTLFEMLIPTDLKAQAPDRRSLVLVLDDDSARFPWELLQERGEAGPAAGTTKPLAVEAGIIRQLGTEAYRQQPTMAKGNAALVVGNPVTTKFSSLAGAETEVEQVATVLHDKGFDVKLLIGDQQRAQQANAREPTAKATPAKAKEVLHALYERDYRIVHLAGHGVYEYALDEAATRCGACGQEVKNRTISGMVLGDNEFLTPALIEQMQSVPDLVFVNCCHLGKSERETNTWANRPSRLAANLAIQLIRMGVRAVVAAGWAVDDKGAETFARVFYQEMLTAATFGDAVKKARAEAYAAHPGVNSWGAYQCYGDPGFTLSESGRGQSLESDETKPLSRAECLVELENIAEDAVTAPEERVEALRNRIETLDRECPQEWRRCAQLVAALGRAYGEMDRFDKAIECYTRALTISDASLPLSAVEQLCNLESRNAIVRRQTEPVQAEKLLKQADERLEGLIRHCGETPERRGLRGSIAKRRAILATDREGKRAALESMRDAYRGQTKAPTEVNPYTLYNELTAHVLLALLSDKPTKPRGLDNALKLVTDAAADADRKDPSFWNAVVQPDCLLLQHMAERNLDDTTVDRLADRYLLAKKRDASPREFRTVVEQFDFYLDVLTVAPSEKVRTELTAALGQIRTKISA